MLSSIPITMDLPKLSPVSFRMTQFLSNLLNVIGSMPCQPRALPACLAGYGRVADFYSLALSRLVFLMIHHDDFDIIAILSSVLSLLRITRNFVHSVA